MGAWVGASVLRWLRTICARHPCDLAVTDAGTHGDAAQVPTPYTSRNQPRSITIASPRNVKIESLFLKVPRGAASRLRMAIYRLLGMKQGIRNRMEGGGRCRRVRQIQIGNYNAFTQGCWLWPEDTDSDRIRIRIGSGNYFNRNLMIDACGYVEIGDENMFGPDIYITDSNHRLAPGISAKNAPMKVGKVRIGSRCWIGAKAIILKDVELGHGCVVAAGAVVTKSFPAGSVIAGVPARLVRTL